MKIHGGDKIEITSCMAFNWTPYLQIKLNGYLQDKSDHEYMLKRCGITLEKALSLQEPIEVIINPFTQQQ